MTVQQVKFMDGEGFIYGGILINDEYLICGECGGVLETEDFEILERYNKWADISDFIMGE